MSTVIEKEKKKERKSGCLQGGNCPRLPKAFILFRAPGNRNMFIAEKLCGLWTGG